MTRLKSPAHRLQTLRLLPEDKNLLGLFLVAVFTLQTIMMAAILLIAVRINDIAHRQPTFAQLVNGKSVVISERQRNWRSEEVIRKTVHDWLTLTFTWTGRVAGANEPDQGIQVERGNKAPTNAWFAARLIEPEFAVEVLREISRLAGVQDVFNGRARAFIVIKDISPPREIAPGKWEVDVISTRSLVQSQGERAEAFDRTITLQAVPPPISPIQTPSPIEQTINDIRASGLMIVDIKPFLPR